MKVTAKWDSPGELDADFATLSKGMQGQAMRAALRAAAKPIVDAAKAEAPSRRVKRSITAIAQGQGRFGALARIGAKKKTPGNRILHLIEHGTRAHGIRPRSKKVLAVASISMRRKFAIISLGGVFGRSVQHPGSRARPFFLKQLSEHKEEAEEKFSRALRKIVTDMQLRKLVKNFRV